MNTRTILELVKGVILQKNIYHYISTYNIFKCQSNTLKWLSV